MTATVSAQFVDRAIINCLQRWNKILGGYKVKDDRKVETAV